MIRTLDEQKEYVRVKIGIEMSNLMFADSLDKKAYYNEQLDYLYGILETLENKR